MAVKAESTELKRVKGGSFRTMNLDSRLYHNIAFENPTPIQRKTIPEILIGRSIVGIGRTGSGKTLCYLIPAVQGAIENKRCLIILPTRELVFQTKRILKMLSRKINLDGRVEITTPNENTHAKDRDMVVVDEFDRILEERSLRERFERMVEGYEGQRVYFSATLPNEPIKDIETIIRLESQIPEAIEHFFYYVPSESKENALLSVLDRSLKTIIFASTKYGVVLLLEILNDMGFGALGIYSGMDEDARKCHFDAFVEGRTMILIVTDVAARGLDIPHLDVSISYDLCDEKTFVHRVGRVREIGKNISFVTYSDVFHFFNIRETHLPEVEIGLMPQDLLDKFDLSKFRYSKERAARGYQRCLKFRGKVCVPSEFKGAIDQFKIHSRFANKETLADQIKRLRSRKTMKTVDEKATFNDPGKEYKDKYYIPYNLKETITHTSAFGINRDDYVREKKEESYRKRRCKNNK